MIRLFRNLLLVPVSVIGFFVACNTGSKNIIPREKMKSLITDLVVAEEFARGKVSKDSSLSERDETLKLYVQVLELHKTSRQEFMKSFDYYLARPEMARAMFDSLAAQVRRDFNQPLPKTE